MKLRWAGFGIAGHGCSVYLGRFVYHTWACGVCFEVADKQSKLHVASVSTEKMLSTATV